MKLNYNPDKETDSFHCLEMDIGTFFFILLVSNKLSTYYL